MTVESPTTYSPLPLEAYVDSDGMVQIIMSTFPTHITLISDETTVHDPARLLIVADPAARDTNGTLCLILWDGPGSRSSAPPQTVVSARVVSGFHGRETRGTIELEDGSSVTWAPARGCGCGARLKSGRIPWDRLPPSSQGLRVVSVSDRPWRAL